jgi:hypothetical protein
VFRDPKLNADLNLTFDKIKVVRGMEGYGWFANVIFSDKDEPKKQYAIDFWFKPDGQELKLMDIRVQHRRHLPRGRARFVRLPVPVARVAFALEPVRVRRLRRRLQHPRRP